MLPSEWPLQMNALLTGSCTSKKWKYTVKVLQPSPAGELVPGMSVGAWLEKNVPTMVKGRCESFPQAVKHACTFRSMLDRIEYKKDLKATLYAESMAKAMLYSVKIVNCCPLRPK